jgi:hypothetical protein
MNWCGVVTLSFSNGLQTIGRIRYWAKDVIERKTIGRKTIGRPNKTIGRKNRRRLGDKENV